MYICSFDCFISKMSAFEQAYHEPLSNWTAQSSVGPSNGVLHRILYGIPVFNVGITMSCHYIVRKDRTSIRCYMI